MGVKISELTEYTEAKDDDILPIVDVENLSTKKINKANFLKDMEQHRYYLTLTEDLADNSELEIPAYYEVGNDSLQVYFEGCLLEKDIHYTEVGEEGSISNKIQILDWGDTIDEGLLFSFTIQGNYEEVSE